MFLTNTFSAMLPLSLLPTFGRRNLLSLQQFFHQRYEDYYVTFGNLSNSFSRSLLKKRLPFNKLDGGDFFSDSLNILSLVFITFINPPFLGWPLQKWFCAQTRGELGYLGLLFHLEYLNVLMYANWAGLIVNTNFHLGEEGSLGEKEGEVGSGEASKLHYCSDRPQDNELCRASRPCSRATKARQAQRKCATAAHSLRYPQQTLVRRLRHGDNNRRKRRTGGQGGGKGGSGRVGKEGCMGRNKQLWDNLNHRFSKYLKYWLIYQWNEMNLGIVQTLNFSFQIQIYLNVNSGNLFRNVWFKFLDDS